MTTVKVDQLGVEKPPRLEAHAPADKLSETKRVEREAKEAHKAELQSKKQKNHDERAAERAAFKEVRAVSNSTSKRAAADAREAARRERRRADGQTCEHGIHRCRICFPIDSRK